MLVWLELLQNCYNVTEKKTARAALGVAQWKRNVSDTRYAVRCGWGYSLIEWKPV